MLAGKFAEFPAVALSRLRHLLDAYSPRRCSTRRHDSKSVTAGTKEEITRVRTSKIQPKVLEAGGSPALESTAGLSPLLASLKEKASLRPPNSTSSKLPTSPVSAPIGDEPGSGGMRQIDYLEKSLEIDSSRCKLRNIQPAITVVEASRGNDVRGRS